MKEIILLIDRLNLNRYTLRKVRATMCNHNNGRSLGSLFTFTNRLLEAKFQLSSLNVRNSSSSFKMVAFKIFN